MGRFVVGRHRASRLHYDLRLEINGVLMSWAVPRGPTLDPTARRMAVHVEDHPIEYLDFEGVIPRGQYGAGDAIAWDWGTFEAEAPTLDPPRAIRDGELKFSLRGEKLIGRFTLVQTGSRDGSGDQWLLIHKRDPFAVPGWDPEALPRSVRTGRTNDEVAAGFPPRFEARPPEAEHPIDLSAAREAPFPGYIKPMLATLAERAFDHPDWLFEVKWDGYRVEAVVRDGMARLWTRNGTDAGTYFPSLVGPAGWIEARDAVVDGEVVALDPEGRPDFGLLQTRLGGAGGDAQSAEASAAPIVYEVFDLLYANGRSLLGVPLEERKRELRRLLRDDPRVRYASHVDGTGLAFFDAARERGLEGMVAKRRRGPYLRGRRTQDWLKIKFRPEQELVVGGYLRGKGSAADLGALLVGYCEGDRLAYAGRVGSGLDSATRRALLEAFKRTTREFTPFADSPEPRGELVGAVWVEPTLVVRVAFTNWTRDGLLRQPSYKGREPGRDPRSVSREHPIDHVPTLRPTPKPDRTTPKPAPMPQTPESEPTRGVARPSTVFPAGSTSGAAGSTAASTIPAEWIATADELEALGRLGTGGTWSVGGRTLQLTNLDKVLFPPPPDRPDEASITKRELIRYLVRIAPTILPHLAARPLNVQRFPDGATAPGFWQKAIPTTAPAWLRRWRETGVEGHRTPNTHLVANNAATMAWLGNQAAFEIHPWTARLDDVFHPTYALIDIDPGARTTWEETLVLARLFRTALEHLGLVAGVKTTGKRGIQVWIPIVPRYSHAETTAWVERLSRAVGSIVPELVSWEWSVEARGGRARLDYTQNSPIRTLVAPYAVRPAPGAPVSTPIAWDELDDPALRPDRWTIRDVLDRVATRGDLFAAVLSTEQELPPI